MDTMKTGPTDPLLHPTEVAKMLSVSLSWLAKARLNGSGPPFVKVGRAVRYLRSAVLDWIRARTRTSTSAT
jgi:predicted DNA-binding transcriptional regulator AlpA